jgi:glycine reductase
MAEEMERTGIVMLNMLSIVPISLTMGANRIVPVVAIPHPLGGPAKSREEKKALSAIKMEVEGSEGFEG